MTATYQLHFISFRNVTQGDAYNCVMGSGANLQPWHLDMLEAWLYRMRTNPPTAEEIENYHRKEPKHESKLTKGRSPSRSVKLDFDILDLL